MIIIAQIRSASDTLIRTVPLKSFSYTKSLAPGGVAVTGEFIAAEDVDADPTDLLVIKVSNGGVTEVHRAGITEIIGRIIRTAGEMVAATPKPIDGAPVIYERSGEIIRIVFNELINTGDTMLIDPPFTINKITSYGNINGLLMELYGG